MASINNEAKIVSMIMILTLHFYFSKDFMELLL